MAKINHNSFIDTVNDTVNQARKKEVIHLQFNGDNWRGNNMELRGQDLVNFGTCGYLGLETHPKLIEGAIDYASRYGTQFSISRAFVTSKQNILLEECLSEMFGGYKTIVFSSTTLAHISVMPIIVGNEDAIILDQQAHLSMQTATQLMAPKGVKTELIRHNNLNMLEEKLIALRDKHNKIWYVIDGVYSMYGDIAPFEDLNNLAKKYPQLHFYVDDAHGIGWYGENGRGCAFEFFKENKRTILVSTMAKGFGSTGGIVVFPDFKTYDKVLVFGGPLAFSHPIAPAIIGASMASAKIHLSPEIIELQKSLKRKINLCNSLLEQTDIPTLSYSETPIYFLGTGKPNVGFNMNKRILNEGYYVNLGLFPAVSIKNTGLRFTITNHVSESEIKGFVEALKYHYPKALEEEGMDINQVRKAFKLPLINEIKLNKKEIKSGLKLQVFNDIHEVAEKEWDAIMGDKAGCTWQNMKIMQEAYFGNPKPEENADMYYFIVFDENDEVVCATVFSLILMKDDMFELPAKSYAVEQIRKDNPYYLVSKTFLMGATFSEGDHLYVNYNTEWRGGLKLILDYLNKELENTNSNNIILRDFETQNEELADFIYDQGFAKITMPNSNVVSDIKNHNIETFFESLSARNRRHIRNDVFKFEIIETRIVDKLSNKELEEAFELLSNVSNKNLSINMFNYPKKLIQEINDSPNWEFIKIILDGKNVGIGFCHKIDNNYYPVLVGLDYEANSSHKVYKQMLYQVVKRAIDLNCDKVYFGLSSDIEKKKLKAMQIPKFAFIYIKDNFNFEQISYILEDGKIYT